MTTADCTIVIPCTSHPNFLHSGLHALIRNSTHHYQILVVWSEPRAIDASRPLANDFETAADGSRSQPFTSLAEFFTHHASWLAEHDIEARDVTEETADLRRCYERGHLYGTARLWDRHVDWISKCQIGLAECMTKYIIPMWDADFHAGRGWDRPLWEYLLSLSEEQAKGETALPMHCMPFHTTPERVADWDTWRDSPPVCCHRLSVPTTRDFVTEAEFEEWCARAREGGPRAPIREPSSLRAQLQWMPRIFRTVDLREVGGHAYSGNGSDMEMDNRCGVWNVMKTGFPDAFVGHKIFPPIEPGWCPYRQ